MVTLAGLSFVLATAFCGCGSGGGSNVTIPPETSAALPTITADAAQNGAVLVTLSDSTSGAAIHYTTDGTSPLTTFQVYQAPFLVASNLTVNAVATATGYTVSNLATQTFAPNIPSGTLVWSDEFTNTTGANIQPNPAVWGYDTGNGTSGWGNNELEDYCAWNSSASPCDPANPNVYVGTDSALHILARAPAAGSYTSGRVKSQGLFSYQYGRLEAKIWLPEGQGIWPAFWLLGNNISTVNWPACGEMDIAERVNAAGSSPAGNGAMLPPGSPDWNEGSIHGTGFTGGTGLGTIYNFPAPPNRRRMAHLRHGLEQKHRRLLHRRPLCSLRHLHQPRQPHRPLWRGLALRRRPKQLHYHEHRRRRQLARQSRLNHHLPRRNEG